MAPQAPEDVHEYISFEDPEEDRTWVFDVTFLMSGWTCIFGHGCQGVLTGPAPELVQGCCSYGAHFIDDEDVATVEATAARLTDEQWQHRRKARRNGFFRTEPDGTRITRLVDESELFGRLWAANDVAPFESTRREFDHPTAGRLEFDHHRFAILDQPGTQLVVYTPIPGSDSAVRLRRSR